MNKIRVDIIHQLYNHYLKRNADESGINTYYKYTNNKENISKLIKIIINSDEYKLKNNNNNKNNSSNRISHINYIFDQNFFEPIKNPLIKLIDLLILTDYEKYSNEELYKRRNMVMTNLYDINLKNRNFTIFPHLEYSFNTEKFNDSLKLFKNFKYYIIYISIWSLWKKLIGKEIDDMTSTFLIKLNDIQDFNSLFTVTSDFFINYLSIKISNKVLTESEKIYFKNFILNENSKDAILFLESISHMSKITEEEIIKQNIDKLYENLSRKPKVLIMVPYLESQNLYFLEKMMYHINKVKENNSELDIDFALDNERINKEPSDYTPWSKVKRIRNLMIHKYPIKDYDYLFLIDSDILDYPHRFISRAIGLNPDGITAPLVLVENTTLFYDIAGFQQNNKTVILKDNLLNNNFEKITINRQPPYICDNNYLSEIDCVGSIYVVPSNIFTLTYCNRKKDLYELFEYFGLKNHKINEDIVQFEDHPYFTDHYTVCTAAKANGYKVLLDKCSVAYHADLPMYGESWH